jgi:hydrogenase nickel incorporation protein HypA/HybF
MADLMRQIDEVAKFERARRVVRVSVRIGALSHFSAEHFAEHFERASGGTLAESAELVAAISTDPNDPDAQGVVLESVEVET